MNAEPPTARLQLEDQLRRPGYRNSFCLGAHCDSMSESVFKFHPVEVRTELSPDDAARLRELICEHNPSSIDPNSFSLETFGTPQFLDCGTRFESVCCPQCGAMLNHAEWQSAMDADFSTATGFRLSESIRCPCGNTATLDNLTYHATCAFASACLSVRVHSHFFTGWLNDLPAFGFVEASY